MEMKNSHWEQAGSKLSGVSEIPSPERERERGNSKTSCA